MIHICDAKLMGWLYHRAQARGLAGNKTIGQSSPNPSADLSQYSNGFVTREGEVGGSSLTSRTRAPKHQ